MFSIPLDISVRHWAFNAAMVTERLGVGGGGGGEGVGRRNVCAAR